MITSTFSLRKSDIEESFRLLSFLLSYEPHLGIELKNDISGDTLIITQEMQCIAKAQFLIVLYNLVESTVCDCLNAIYDAIMDDGLVYGDLSEEMKQIWRAYIQRKNIPRNLKSENEIINTPIIFDGLAVNISGSLDYRKLLDVFSKHGCVLDDSKRLVIADSFLTVKNRRNLLAHGNISFSECGSNYLLSDLLKFKLDIVNYMEDIVKKINAFIISGLYGTKNSTV